LPKTVKTEFGSSKKKLSESSKAPTEAEISESIDGPKAEADPVDEFEALAPHPASSEESKSHFGKLKEAAREFRDKAKTLESKLAPLAQEFGLPVDDIDGLVNSVRALKTQPGLAPQDSQELEVLRVFSKASHLENSISYIRGYKQPIAAAKLAWIDKAAQYWNNSPEAILRLDTKTEGKCSAFLRDQ
jgi:hypothetical protein